MRRLTLTGLVAGCVLALAACGAPTGGGSQPRASSIPFFGLDVPKADPAEVTRVSAVLGCRPSVISVFVKLDSAFTVRSLSSVSQGGATPFVTLEPWGQALRPGQVREPALSLDSITVGSHDPDLARIAKVIAAYERPVYLRYAHEMNGDWYPWSVRANGGSPQAYVSAFRHVHDLFARAGARNVRWLWAPVTVVAGPDGAYGNLPASYPGDAYVDYVGFTGYAKTVRSARETFAPWIDAVSAFTSRPVILAEIGADGAHKSEWIASLQEYLASTPSIDGFIWFNTTPASTGATGYYRIDNSANQSAAFKAVLVGLHIPCPPSLRGTSA